MGSVSQDCPPSNTGYNFPGVSKILTFLPGPLHSQGFATTLSGLKVARTILQNSGEHYTHDCHVIIKDTNKWPNEEIHRGKIRKVQNTGLWTPKVQTLKVISTSQFKIQGTGMGDHSPRTSVSSTTRKLHRAWCLEFYIGFHNVGMVGYVLDHY